MTQEHAPASLGFVDFNEQSKEMGTVIVFDRKTGRIVHTHHFVHLGTGAPPSKAAMEQKALRSAGASASTHDNLDVLHLSAPLKENSLHCVDLNTKNLIEVSQK